MFLLPSLLCAALVACSPISVLESIPAPFTPLSNVPAAATVVRSITAYTTATLAPHALRPTPTVFAAEAQDDAPITLIETEVVYSYAPTTVTTTAVLTVTVGAPTIAPSSSPAADPSMPEPTPNPSTSPSSASTQAQTSVPSAVPTLPPTPPLATLTWTQPATMADLSAWGVDAFPAYGKKNFAIVSSVPASAYATAPTPSQPVALPPLLAGDALPANFSFSDLLPGTNSSHSTPSDAPQAGPPSEGALLRLFYPASSINPSSATPGGADFYASPFPAARLARARTMTLAYRVLFPAGFDFVKGGKLPGLYGGHRGCSGGDDARACWSTRLMWRAKGEGELYLYAPKTQQTKALCAAPPKSVCESTYGLSVARRAFAFRTGAWTSVKQTVALNTPGVPDGLFVLEVDGAEVIRRADVVYRAARVDAGAGAGKGEEGAGQGQGDAPGAGASPDQGNGDVLGGLLGGILRRDASARAPPTYPLALAPDGQVIVGAPAARPAPLALQGGGQEEVDDAGGEVGFAGMFFSTFFGGHEREYASPRDQYVWFAGFEMTVA